MSVKLNLIICVSLIMSGGVVSLFGAPPYHPQQQRGDPSGMKETMEDLKYELNNHDVELRVFEERINTQETIIDSLRQQVMDSLAGSDAVTLEAKLTTYGKDLQRLQAHANESSKALSQYKQKIGEIEKQVQALQSAMNTLVEALQVDVPKTVKSSQSDTVYVVKAGDTLEKIARRHKATAAQIKNVNQLKNDKIFIGQKLTIPAK